MESSKHLLHDVYDDGSRPIGDPLAHLGEDLKGIRQKFCDADRREAAKPRIDLELRKNSKRLSFGDILRLPLEFFRSVKDWYQEQKSM